MTKNWLDLSKFKPDQVQKIKNLIDRIEEGKNRDNKSFYKNHFLSLAYLTANQVKDIIKLAQEIKKYPKKYRNKLQDKTLLMIFEKASLRTRVSFEVAMTQLGGHAIYYNIATSPLGKKETIEDTARCASCYVDIIMARLFKFAELEKLAQYSTVPVIDALSDMNHPCQIMGDLLTIQEKKKKLKGLKLVYLGDAENNVTYSLLHGCALVGMDIVIGCPGNKEFKPKKQIIEEAKKIAQKTGSNIEILHNASKAAKSADIIYTDSWTSYHIDIRKEKTRKKKLMPFQVTEKLLEYAKDEVIFMNCLPAMRGYEQTAEVIDGTHSVVFDQAENRLHIQKAILIWLLEQKRMAG